MWAYSLGRINTLCSHLNTRFKADIKTKLCLKMLYFWKKTRKIAAALGVEPPNPHWPPAAGSSASRPPSCYSRHLFQLLKNCNLLSHTRVTVSAPLAELALLAQTSSYATADEYGFNIIKYLCCYK